MKSPRNSQSIADGATGIAEISNLREPLEEQCVSGLSSDPDIVIEDGFLVLRANEPTDAVSSILNDREDRMAFLSKTHR